jgi:allantoinase
VGRVDLLIRGRRVACPDGIRPAAVGVTGGEIVAVAPYDTALSGAQTVELAGDEVLLPGLVDTHVHINEPGRTDWEGFATATRAAAAGGITTLIDMPLNSVPPTVTVDALRAKRAAAAGQCHVDVGFWGGAVPGNEAERGPLLQAGVFGFKCFTVDSGVPEFPPLDANGLERAMRQAAGLGCVLIVHAEDAATLDAAPAAAGPDYGGFLRSRPAAAELTAITGVIELARAAGARAHVLHLSAAGALPAIAAAKLDGVPLTVESCPHYLALAAEDVPAGGTLFKCCPPIRDRANADELWTGLRARVIDCVVSDHSPSPPQLKDPEHGDFGAAWGGIASLQLSLPVVWSQARARGCPLADVVRWMAAAPAGLAGLHRKGRIAAGCDGDLVVFAPEEEFVVEPELLLYRHPLTPYAGQTLRGVVRRTWLRGMVAGGAGTGAPGAEPAGQLLTRQRAGRGAGRAAADQAAGQGRGHR